MICRILLLISLTSCVSGTFVVKVPQTSYQAEENNNITLEWTFTTKLDSSSSSLHIICKLLTVNKPSVLYHVDGGDEVPKSQDKHFIGRVQCDKDALREGQIRLHVSRLRTDDSGLYKCDVLTDYGTSSDRCNLNVTAAVDQPKPQKPTERPQPTSRGRIGLYFVLAAAGIAVCVGLCRFIPSIHPSSSAYPGSGRGGSSLSRDAQTSLSPATSSSSSRGIPRRSQASRET